VIGTMGQLPEGAVLLVETPDDVLRLQVPPDRELAFATQTTLSVDDTVEMVNALKARFPAIHGPHKEDICYATTNRQEAVKAVAPKVEALLVVGSPNSSNSQRLREVAENEGCRIARLILRAEDIPWSDLADVGRVGLTAGASAPEILIDEIVDAFRERYELTIETVNVADETMFFPLPRELRETV
jgi:4-hydroxy-3-methylbut-2-enyl diphosphate reductase